MLRLRRHANEQIGMVEHGKLKLVVDDEEQIVSSSETCLIPPTRMKRRNSAEAA